MKTVQEIFKSLLKEMIAPRLREEGLKGSGQNYAIPSDNYWALIGFQKSMFSDSQEINFTINLYVVNKQEWEKARVERSYFPAKPTSTTQWGIGWSRRIGFLFPERSDHWWTLNMTTDLGKLSDQVIESIVKLAVPAMNEEMKNA